MSNFSSTKTSPNAAGAPRPRFGKIPAAMAYSGFGRTKLYEELPAIQDFLGRPAQARWWTSSSLTSC